MTIKSPRRWRRLIVLRGSSRSLKNWSIETTSSELTLRILRSPWPTNQVNWKAIGLPLIQLPRYPKFPKVRVSPGDQCQLHADRVGNLLWHALGHVPCFLIVGFGFASFLVGRSPSRSKGVGSRLFPLGGLFGI